MFDLYLWDRSQENFPNQYFVVQVGDDPPSRTVFFCGSFFNLFDAQVAKIQAEWDDRSRSIDI